MNLAAWVLVGGAAGILVALVLARLFPRAEIVVVPDYTTLPDFTKIDAAIWTLEQAGAIARSHPGITAVVPKDVGNPFLLTYLMPPHSDEMVHFVSYWLDLRKADGMRAREVSYWLLGPAPHAGLTALERGA